MIEVRVLGPLEAIRDGEQLDLGGGKQRALLAALILERGGWVPLDRLIDRLWGDAPPPSAAGTLQAYVSNLRRVLEPGKRARGYEVLVSRARGYELAIDPERVDAWRFERLTGEAGELLAGGKPVPALAVLDEALGLWRGDALVDLAEEPFAQAEGRRLEELRRLAIEQRLDARLALGESDAVAADAEKLLALDPLRERTWGSLMVALYRAGRQADALAAYRRARDTLADELGVDPGPALQRLEADILAQAPSLEAPPPVAAPAGAAHPTLPRQTIVGRDGEVVGLAMLLNEAAHGQGSVVLLHGEPGIGKTRLAEEVAALAGDARIPVAWGRCVGGVAMPPLWPWRQILETLGLGDELPVQGAEEAEVTTRAALYQRIVNGLAARAAEGPLVLILDDAQWAGEPSLELLRFVGPVAREAAILVVVTYRDTEAGPALLDAVAELTRVSRVERLPLGGLTREGVGGLLATTMDHEPSPDLVEALHDRTEGNPFFLREMIRLLQSEDALDMASQRTVLGVGVPLGVRDVIGRRLAVLPGDATSILSLASAVGREFDIGVVAHAGAIEADALLELLEPAGELGIVVPMEAGRFRFSHDLVRETLYDGTSPMRRARLHAKIADALVALREGDPGSVQALAQHHWEGAAIVGSDRAVSYLLAAADQAEALLAYETAEERLRQALVLLDGVQPTERSMGLQMRTVARLARFRSILCGYSAPEAGEALERARALAELMDAGEELMVSLWGLWSYHCVRAEFEASIDKGRRLLQIGEERDDDLFRAAGHQALGVTALHRGEFDHSIEHLTFVAETSFDLSDAKLAELFHQEPSVSSRAFLALATSMLDRIDDAWRWMDEAVARADQMDEPFTRAYAASMESWLAAVDDQPERAFDAAARAIEISEAHGFQMWLAAAPIPLGWARAKGGAVQDGLATVERGLAMLDEIGTRMLRPYYFALYAEVLALAGRADAAADVIARAREHAATTGEHLYDARLDRLVDRLSTSGNDPLAAR